MSALWAGLFAAALGVAGLGFIYGALHWRENPGPVRFWALAALAASAAGVWETWLVISGAYDGAPHLVGLFNGALLALGPCLWLQARAAAGLSTPRRVQAAQFLPFLAHGVLLALFVWPLEADQKRALAALSLSTTQRADWVGAAKLLHLTLYAGLIVATARQGLTRMRARLSRFDAAELYWIAGFALALGITALALLIASTAAPARNAALLNTAGSLVLAVLAVAIAARSLRAPTPPALSPAPRYARSGLDAERLAVFARRIEQTMARDRLHADPELTLDRLAAAVRLTPQQVSQALNQALGHSFYSYVNGRRVEAAKALLQRSDLTVLDAAMEAGFATKATFNKAFKAATGLTPTQYRTERG